MPKSTTLDAPPTESNLAWFYIYGETKVHHIRADVLVRRFLKYLPDESFHELFCFDRGMTVPGFLSVWKSLLEVCAKSHVCISNIDDSPALKWWDQTIDNRLQNQAVIEFVPLPKS